VGEKVALLYARDDPRLVNIDDFAMLWADVVVVFIVAAVLLASGGTAFWIAGGRPAGRRGRFEASLPEMQRAWRESRLTRDSEFQPVLIGFALAGFPVLGAAIAFVLFAPGVVQVIVVAILAWIALRVIRDKRRARSQPSQRR
jgi:NhaP-type Na+/H+ or K+/H+ antiporter